MKNFKLKRLLGLTLVGGFSVLQATTAFAAAGDPIDNTATLTYKVGLATPTVTSNTTTFAEDRLLNFTVTTQDISAVPGAAGSTGIMTTFRVTNNGNGEQDFLLSAFNAADGVDDAFAEVGVDSFNVGFDNIFVNSVFNEVAGTYALATDIATYIDQLPAGSYVDVFVFSTMPTPPPLLASGALSVISLVAQVADETNGAGGGINSGAGFEGAAIAADDSGSADTAAVQTVFLDTANGVNAATGDGVNDGLASAESAYIISAAVLDVTKSASIALWNDLTLNVFPKMIPGHNAYIEYTLLVENTGTASGDLTTLFDDLPANMALDPDYRDGTAANNPNSAAGDAFQIDLSGTGRVAAGVNLGISYCTATAGDGCSSVVGAGGSATVDFSLLAVTGAEAGWSAGELKPGESITVKFNAILQ